MVIGEFKARFSEAVEHGEKIVICFGRQQRSVAVLGPHSVYKNKNSVRLEALSKSASVRFADHCEMSAEELVGD